MRVVNPWMLLLKPRIKSEGINEGLALPCTAHVLYMRKLGKICVEFLRRKNPALAMER